MPLVMKQLAIPGQTDAMMFPLLGCSPFVRKGKPVSTEQMEISRLRAELAHVKIQRDILGKAAAYFASGSI